jgi:hypothetical protein
MARRQALSADLESKIINHPAFQKEVSSYAAKTGKEGIEAQNQVRDLVYRTFYRPDGTAKQFSRMTDRHDGPRGRFLKRIGLKAEDDTTPVGQTPRRKRR